MPSNGKTPDLPNNPSEEDYGSAFPASRRVYVDGSRPDLRVPVREITLAGGEPPLRVYDTSGPLGGDVQVGLPGLRTPWIAERGGVNEVETSYRPLDAKEAEIPEALRNRPLRSTGGPVTQLHYAGKGEITPEIEFAALREGMEPEFVRSEIARGRAILPSNINHPESEPMIIGRNFKVKINANIGNSAVSSSIEEEVAKLRWATPRPATAPVTRSAITSASSGSATNSSISLTASGSRK